MISNSIIGYGSIFNKLTTKDAALTLKVNVTFDNLNIKFVHQIVQMPIFTYHDTNVNIPKSFCIKQTFFGRFFFWHFMDRFQRFIQKHNSYKRWS